jgi:hypothetical protein
MADATTEVRRGPGRPPRDLEKSREPDGRRKRVPLGAPQNKMAASQRSGYSRRWINDEAGRLQEAEEGGYQFVKEGDANSTDTGTRKSLTVGKHEDGTPLRAYLMEIPLEFYEEDQVAKQQEIDATDEAIRTGSVAGQNGADGRYIPSQGISYKTGRNGRSAPKSIQPNDGDH